ncbi:MAG: tRNA (adenosine(37)-N6)-threonylcarbamoyltransferase complex ATPase subunit type 1 TsaE, partial [Sphingomonadaceae bacterium]
LEGPLGVGKTTLVRFVLHALGHEGQVPSPSFALVQPYDRLDPPVLHADLYRLVDPEELLEIGLEDDPRAIQLVEWPDRAGEGAFSRALALRLAFEPDGETRRLTWSVPLAWEGRWP